MFPTFLLQVCCYYCYETFKISAPYKNKCISDRIVVTTKNLCTTSLNMKIISHRGNLDGPTPDRENSPDFIKKALKSGYHVEIDLRIIDGKFWLGHDGPQYEVVSEFLHNPGF